MESFLILLRPFIAGLASYAIINSIRFIDAIEKEPIKPIISSLIIGIAVAFICSGGYFFDIGYQLALIFNGDEKMQKVLSIVIDAPLNEELLKAIGLLIVFKYFRKEFDSLTDFVIYACFVAIGFQFLENLGYMLFALDSTENAIEAWNSELTYRVVDSGFMHLIWTSWSGVGLWLFCHGEKKWLPRFIQLSRII